MAVEDLPVIYGTRTKRKRTYIIHVHVYCICTHSACTCTVNPRYTGFPGENKTEL